MNWLNGERPLKGSLWKFLKAAASRLTRTGRKAVGSLVPLRPEVGAACKTLLARLTVRPPRRAPAVSCQQETEVLYLLLAIMGGATYIHLVTPTKPVVRPSPLLIPVSRVSSLFRACDLLGTGLTTKTKMK